MDGIALCQNAYIQSSSSVPSHRTIGERQPQNDAVTTDAKPFKCSSCNRSFTRRAILMDHVRTHEDERPYQCRECPKAFTRRSDLVRHDREKHDGKRHRCACGKSFSRASTLTKHKTACSESCLIGHLGLHTEHESGEHLRSKESRRDKSTAENGMSVLKFRLAVRRMSTRTVVNIDTRETQLTLWCNVCFANMSPDMIIPFLRHVVNHVQDMVYRPYVCGVCKFPFGFKEDLMVHHDSHNRGTTHCPGPMFDSISSSEPRLERTPWKHFPDRISFTSVGYHPDFYDLFIVQEQQLLAAAKKKILQAVFWLRDTESLDMVEFLRLVIAHVDHLTTEFGLDFDGVGLLDSRSTEVSSLLSSLKFGQVS